MPYFDHNATHPLSPAARAAWLDAVERFPANPSSPHRAGARAEAALDDARDRIARRLGSDPDALVWVSGATEAANTLVHHLARTTRGPVLISPIEHPCVRASARQWLGDRCVEIPVTRQGVAQLDWITDRVAQGDAGAVILMAANNETGVLQPWPEVGRACAAAGIPYFCDAAQWIGRLPMPDPGPTTWLAASAHKFGGPQGVGFIRCAGELTPLLVGGPQEGGRRAGTENVAGILSAAAALEDRWKTMEAGTGTGTPTVAQRTAWRDQFIGQLLALDDRVTVLGAEVPRLWNTVAALMPPASDCRRRWVVKLDRLGVEASTGSACSSGREVPSHVLAAMGCLPGESDRMVRFSAGWETTEADWAALTEAVRRAAAELLAAPRDPSPQGASTHRG